MAAGIAWALASAMHAPAGAAPAGTGQTAPLTPPPLRLTVSNYQYCQQAPCRYPTDAAYRRSTSGPVPGSDNPSHFVAVSPGQTIIWTYEDTTANGGPASCDFYGTPPYPSDPTLGCIGHAVNLEDGNPEGNPIGEFPARQGPATIRWAVPPDAQPGALIRYFCNVRDGYLPGGMPHWLLGMTGGLTVRPVRVSRGAARPTGGDRALRSRSPTARNRDRRRCQGRAPPGAGRGQRGRGRGRRHGCGRGRRTVPHLVGRSFVGRSSRGGHR